MATGIDVSYAQGKPAWAKVKATGKIDFVYAKASGGDKTVDSSFAYNWAELPKAGLPRGAYHFYIASIDPIIQAEHFFKTVGPLNDSDLPPMLDVEQTRPASKTGDQYAKDVLACIEHLEKLFERRVVVYTGLSIIIAEMKGAAPETLAALATRDLWLAAYVNDPTKWVPPCWQSKGWVIWQKSGDVAADGKPGFRIDGIGSVVDLDVTQGAANDLVDWIEASKLKKPESVPMVPAPEPPPSPVPQEEQPVPPTPEPVAPSPDPPKPVPSAPIVPGNPTGFLATFFAFIRAIFMFLTGRKGS